MLVVSEHLAQPVENQETGRLGEMCVLLALTHEGREAFTFCYGTGAPLPEVRKDKLLGQGPH